MQFTVIDVHHACLIQDSKILHDSSKLNRKRQKKKMFIEFHYITDDFKAKQFPKIGSSKVTVILSIISKNLMKKTKKNTNGRNREVKRKQKQRKTEKRSLFAPCFSRFFTMNFVILFHLTFKSLQRKEEK
jgi:hypothetical protein